MASPPPRIFDASVRTRHRERADPGVLGAVEDHVAELLLERIDTLETPPSAALVINAGLGRLADALRTRGITVATTDHAPRFGHRVEAEDRLVTAPDFDLVLVPWGLDTVDDLPGALLLARRALRPGGVFMAVFAGVPTLTTLRAVVAQADGDRAVARIHPQVDVRAGGDLLVRAGFLRAVADSETVRLTYPDLDRLLADLRGVGARNALIVRHRATRGWLDRARAAFAARGDRVEEAVTLIVLTGYAPG